MRSFWSNQDGVTTAEWLALTGAVAIGAATAFWWVESQTGGFQPMANTIQNQVNSAASSSVSSAP